MVAHKSIHPDPTTFTENRFSLCYSMNQDATRRHKPEEEQEVEQVQELLDEVQVGMGQLVVHLGDDGQEESHDMVLDLWQVEPQEGGDYHSQQLNCQNIE